MKGVGKNVVKYLNDFQFGVEIEVQKPFCIVPTGQHYCM
ncbi:hypothetical protein A2U01_0054567, partial [Trifolium medium]|nr:hypothetical protein [Trifolium medium]